MRGLYDQAIACWHNVEKARPGDDEAGRAIASLTVERTLREGGYVGDDAKKASKFGQQVDGAELTPDQRLEREIRRNPKDLGKYIELAEFFIREEQYDKAREVFERALKVDKNNVDIVERMEDVEMRELRTQLMEAEKTAQETGSPADRAKFEEIRRLNMVKELEMAKNRVERYPNNLQYRFQLGQRFQQTGMYSEAISEYQVVRNDPKYRGQCVLSLGQCFQKIKKYRLALTAFEEAIEQIADRDIEHKKRALYQAGKLAVAMRDLEKGERYLTTLAGMDFSYKDVSALLDKLNDLRHNGGPGAGGDNPSA